MNADEKTVFETRARLKGTVDNECDFCGVPLVFALQSGETKFSVDLFTILNCLKMAEKEHYIPAIPNDWWLSIVNHYNGDVEL